MSILDLMESIVKEANSTCVSEDLKSALDADFAAIGDTIKGALSKGTSKVVDRINRGHHEKRFKHHSSEYNKAMAAHDVHRATGNYAGAETAKMKAAMHKERMSHHFNKVHNGGGKIDINPSMDQHRKMDTTATNKANSRIKTSPSGVKGATTRVKGATTKVTEAFELMKAIINEVNRI